MLFDHCQECRKCCHVEPGYPPLEIPLRQAERKQLGRIQVKTTCRFLGNGGCDLGQDKPYACYQYPLSFDPHTLRFYFDADCPLYDRYQQQLRHKGSEALAHLNKVVETIAQMMGTDRRFLQRNHELDADYFELLPLSVPDEVLHALQKAAGAQNRWVSPKAES